MNFFIFGLPLVYAQKRTCVGVMSVWENGYMCFDTRIKQ